MAQRSGVVTDVQGPAPGKKQASAKVGGRKVWFYPTGYQSQEPSELWILLRDAESRGLSITLEGDERPGQGPQGPYTSFTAKSLVQNTNGAAAPPVGSDGWAVDHATSSAPVNYQVVGAKTIEYQRAKSPEEESRIIAQNVLNRAVDLACAERIKLDEIEGQAKDFARMIPAIAKVVEQSLYGASDE